MLQFLANPAFWQGVGNVGSAAGGLAGLFGGGDEPEIPGEVLNYYKQQAELAKLYQQQMGMGIDWSKFMYPQMKDLMGQLNPLIQQQLQQPGLPPELEQQVWNLAKQRSASGYGDVERDLGGIFSSRNMLQSGPAIQAWLQKVGLPRAQGQQQLGTERALANYQAQQQAIGNAQSMLGMTPQASYFPGSMASYSSWFPQPQQTDYTGLGALFAKGMEGIGGWFGKKPGVQTK